MPKTAAKASKDALFAYALSDFLRSLRFHLKRGPLTYDRATWVQLWLSGKKSKEAQEKAWCRWNDRVCALGLSRKVDNLSYEIDETASLAWVEQTIQRGNELAEAHRQATGVSLEVIRPASGGVRRDLTTLETAALFDVAKPALYEWVRLGAPHSRKKHRKELSFNERELRAWLVSRMDSSRRVSCQHENRVPADERNMRVLRAAKDAFGLSVKTFAARLGVTHHSLRLWFMNRQDTIPASSVAIAEAMLRDRGLDPDKATLPAKEARLPREEASRRIQAVREALNMSIMGMSKELGVPEPTLKSWLGSGSAIAATVPVWAVEGAEELLGKRKRRISKLVNSKLVDPDVVREAFRESKGSSAKAARILGVCVSSAADAAKKLGIETLKVVDLSEVISPEALKAALERHTGVIAAAARDLGVDPASVRRLVKKYGISVPRRSDLGSVR